MKKLFTVFLSCALIAAAAMPFTAALAEKTEETAQIYESFDDYETAKDRSGKAGGIYAQMASWSGNPATFTGAAGDPVGSVTGKSLKMTSSGNNTLNIWSNGTKDPAKLDQTGAKYVKFYVRSLNAKDRDLGIYVTDILQETIDSFALPENADKIPDGGQEHWSIKWNKSAVLETLDGKKSAATSVNGSAITIPAGFEGSVSVPLDKSTLENPSWFTAQPNIDYINREIDLDRIFSVSFYFPEVTDVVGSDPSTHIVFEVDNVSFCKDDSVKQYLDSLREEDAALAENVIRPTTSSIAIDHMKGTIALDKEWTRKEFTEAFSLPAGYKIVIKDADGFEVTSDTAKIPDKAEVTFTDEKKPFTYTVSMKTDDGGSARRGCASSVAGVSILAGLSIALGASVLLRRKKNEN